MTQHATRYALFAFLLTTLTGCFGSPAPREEFFYFLSGPHVPLEHSTGPRLLVRNFGASPGYDSTNIAYRSTKHELRYWSYRRWVTEPSRLVTEMAARHLRASSLFSAVDVENEYAEPHAVLEGNLVAVEEIDGEDEWQARLAMTFRLRRPRSDDVIARFAFDEIKPCEERHPRAVADVVSGILATQMRKLSGQIAQAIKEQ